MKKLMWALVDILWMAAFVALVVVMLLECAGGMAMEGM